MATDHPPSGGGPNAATCPPRLISPGSSSAATRSRANPFPNAPTSNLTSANRVIVQGDAWTTRCRRPANATGEPTVGSKARPVRRDHVASSVTNSQSQDGADQGSPTGCRFRTLIRLAGRHVLKSRSVTSTVVTNLLRARVARARECAVTANEARVPIK